jgi:hypothetical protein
MQQAQETLDWKTEFGGLAQMPPDDAFNRYIELLEILYRVYPDAPSAHDVMAELGCWPEVLAYFRTLAAA